MLILQKLMDEMFSPSFKEVEVRCLGLIYKHICKNSQIFHNLNLNRGIFHFQSHSMSMLCVIQKLACIK